MISQIIAVIDEHGPLWAMLYALIGSVALTFSVLIGLFTVLTWPFWLLVYYIHKGNKGDKIGYGH